MDDAVRGLGAAAAGGSSSPPPIARLERLCRYVLRPPVSEARIEHSGDRGVLALKAPWNDGTTHLRFGPVELLERLAALLPRPQKNLLRYHGVFAANARHRSAIVAYGRPRDPSRVPQKSRPSSQRHNPNGGEVMRRGLDIDSLECPRCKARMRFVASILRPAILRRVLESVQLPADPIVPTAARAAHRRPLRRRGGGQIQVLSIRLQMHHSGTLAATSLRTMGR